MSDTLAVLVLARVLVEQGWTQGCFGRDESGQPVKVGEISGASCWCVAGAIGAATAGGSKFLVGDALDALAAAIGTEGVSGWNDDPGRTQAEVLAAFDAAIAALEGA